MPNHTPDIQPAARNKTIHSDVVNRATLLEIISNNGGDYEMVIVFCLSDCSEQDNENIEMIQQNL